MAKRIISIILAVCMLGSLAVVVASAEENTEKTFNYVALGDSIAAGYGLTAPGTEVDPALVLSEELIANPVQDAYAQVFGKWLAETGAKYGYTTTATNLSSTAYRAEDVAATITTPGYKGAVASYIFEAFVGEGASAMLLPYHDIYNKYLPEADMVSIQLGANDIIMGIIYPMIEADNPVLNDMAIAVALLLFGRTPTEAIGAGVQLMIRDKDKITSAHIAEAVKYFGGVIKNTSMYVENAAANVELVVNAVQEVNPNADIALVGMFNPYGNSLEYEGQVRDICNVAQNIFVKAIDEAVDINIEVGDVQFVPVDQAKEKTENLNDLSVQIKDIVVNRSYFDEMRKARAKALLTIAANELAYPIQYLTAGKNVDPQIKLLNTRLQEIADRTGATFVDVYDISNECNTDPHPTAAGHKEIADRLEATMRSTILTRMGVIVENALGDANGDGIISVADVTAIQRFISEISVENFNEALADVNNDGKITIDDATLIQQYLAEEPVDYPIGNPANA